MVHDKILAQIVNEDVHRNLDENRFRGKFWQDTNSAKILINYKATIEGMNKILFIDLKKAFDSVDRTNLNIKLLKENNLQSKEIILNIL